jgi:hypothetical protein
MEIVHWTGIREDHIHAVIQECAQTAHIPETPKVTILQNILHKSPKQSKLLRWLTIDYLPIELHLISSLMEPYSKTEPHSSGEGKPEVNSIFDCYRLISADEFWQVRLQIADLLIQKPIQTQNGR